MLRRITKAIADHGRSIGARRLLAASGSASRPHEIFRGVDDERWLWLNTEGYRRVPALRQLLPALPPDYFQLATASTVGDETLGQAFDVYRLYRDMIERHYRPVAECRAILDFGCGWGRVMRFFLRDIEPSRLWGIEMWDQQVEQAKATNRWCNFLHVQKDPPTQLATGQFDVIMSFSVFSHIAEAAHLRWLGEFKRLLAPGGLLIASTWGRDHADRMERIKAGARGVWDNHYNKAIAERFPGKETWLSWYDAGRFCHVDLGYEGYSDYGETAIPESYARRMWSESFEILEYVSDRARCLQDVIVARG